MEIKEGMYVRTRGGTIGILGKPMGLGGRHEIINSLNQLYAEDNVRLDNVKKTSYELIDLVQKDDYVNGYKIVSIGKITNGDEKGKKVLDYFDGENYSDCLIYLRNEDIETIVTKEQFEEMQYEVGE